MSGMFNSDSTKTLLSGFGNSTNSTTSNGLYGINLSDYASIKNGSYGKLVKSYYAIEDGEDTKKTNSKNDTDDTDAVLTGIKNSAANLKESAAVLYSSKSLFEKDKDGAYNMEAIYEKVNAFVEDYNSMLKNVGSAETESIAKAGANLVNATTTNADMLSKLGISIDTSDYTLSIDKDKFLQSDISDVKSVFNGIGSFAYQVGAKASRIYNMVADKVGTTGAHTSAKTEISSSTSKDTASTIAEVKEKADTMVATGTDLYKNRTLFQTKTDGSYDTKKILEEIGGFVKDYNALITAGKNSKSSGMENAIKAISGVAGSYQKDLEKIGITKNEDGTLKLDENTFAKASMKDAKALFLGTGSFAYEVTAKAAMAANQAELEANKSNTYTNTADYSNNYNIGTILDSMM